MKMAELLSMKLYPFTVNCLILQLAVKIVYSVTLGRSVVCVLGKPTSREATVSGTVARDLLWIRIPESA